MDTDIETTKLYIPEGINYECTACGKCCSGWSVPMTESDYKRISRVNWADHSNKYARVNLFRPMKAYEVRGTPYTHAIKEGDDGHCPFLVDNLCFIHSKFDAQTKPSICQLFPYCFNETPSGVYATVSFVSMGVVHNSGASLIEQRDYLEKKFAEFRRLFPDHHPNWTKLELTIGKPIKWEEYLSIEQTLLTYIKERDLPLEQRFLKGSDCLMSIAGIKRVTEQQREASSKLKFLDKNLVVALYKIYFPAKMLGRGEGDFDAFRFFFQIAFQNIVPGLRISVPGHSFSIEELRDRSWPCDDRDIEDLLYRYFYSRIFAKLYFGAGFGQLSLITGFHHLAIVYALIKLYAKALSIVRSAPQVSYVDVIASVRQLEKRLGETALDGYAAAVFETLMFSPGRIKRILVNS